MKLKNWQSIVNSRLKTTIKAIQDSNNPPTYFTETYLDQFKSRITGVLNAITKPTTISQILTTFKFPNKIFITIAQELVKDKVKGHFTSYSNNGLFIPETYSKIQNDYVESFLKQNHYIEYDSLNRIGIADIKNYFKKCDNLISLKSCLIDRSVYKQIESGIEDALIEEYLVDLYTLAPSVLTKDDFSVLVDLFISSNKKQSDNLILIGTYVITKKYLDKLKSEFNLLLKEKAEKDLKDGQLANYFVEKNSTSRQNDQVLSKKEERRKQNASKSKSGGGTQGREVKTKSTKKKYNKKDESFLDDDEFNQTFNSGKQESSGCANLKFMNSNEIEEQLNKIYQQNELSEEIREEIANLLEPILNDQYIEVAKDIWISSQTVSGSVVKKTHGELQKSIQQFVDNIFMFNRGLEFVSGELQTQLKKYLCKTLCTDLMNSLLSYSSTSDENNLSTTESRAKVIKKLDEELIEPFNKLNQSIASNDVDQTLQDAYAAFEKLDLMVRKVDKRRESSILSENKHNLLKQLQEIHDTETALILHLSVILLFNEAYKTMLHASGKFVPQLISQLKSKLDSATFDLLFDCEQLVMKSFRNEQDQESEDKLKEVIIKVKNVAHLLPKDKFVN